MSKRIETEIANTFRQFAKDEKDKLQAKKQALQKKEKESLLQGLMKFHQTFKLNVPVPPDLVPLLSSKKPSSPEEAPAKPAEKKAEEVKTTSPPASKPSVPETSETKPKPSKPSDKTAETKPAAAKPSFKFNVKAMEFKPNPAAPAFVPVSLWVWVATWPGITSLSFCRAASRPPRQQRPRLSLPGVSLRRAT